MLHHNALRLARRSGRIDNVGQMVRPVNRLQIGAIGAVGVLVIECQYGSRIGDAVQQPPLSQQQLCTRIFQQVADALLGIFGIDRHVCASGFQHRQDADDHIHRASGHQADKLVRLHTLRTQRTRQSVRPLVQLPVGETFLLENHRCRFRNAGSLLLDQPVNRFFRLIVRFRLVKSVNKPALFLRRQHSRPCRFLIKVI